MGYPHHPREIVPPAGREHPHHPLGVLERSGHGTQQAVAAERNRNLSTSGRDPCELGGVLEAAGRLHAVLEAQHGERLARLVQRKAGAAPASRGVDDHRQPPHEERTSERRSTAIATGPGS